VWIGDLEVWPVSDGTFRLDGGAMFGTVPKVLWEKRAPADERNRIQLGLNALVVRSGHTHVLIDAGIGGKLSPKERDIFAVDRPQTLVESLAAIGLEPGDIDQVIATHQHLDHAGVFTAVVNDRVVPVFSRAQHVVRRGEWEDATHPHQRNRASYLPDDFMPLQAAGLVEFIEHDGEIVSGLSVWRTGGHTAHHQIVKLESGGRRALFPADLFPTTAHVDPAWVMGYDLYPVETLRARLRWLEEAIAGEYVIFFEHDPAMTAGIIRRDTGRLRVDPVPV
jgi:glyoxylase-like metal-dependent hydrolase (beta-lactamase superfamily II)